MTHEGKYLSMDLYDYEGIHSYEKTFAVGHFGATVEHVIANAAYILDEFFLDDEYRLLDDDVLLKEFATKCLNNLCDEGFMINIVNEPLDKSRDWDCARLSWLSDEDDACSHNDDAERIRTLLSKHTGGQ